VRAPTEGKRRSRKRPLKLTPAEIAEIDELIARRRQETEWECQEVVLQEEEEERQLLLRLRKDPTGGPWPTPWPKQPGTKTSLSFDGCVYVHEEDALPARHPFLVEMARRDGMIRYAWTGGLTFDLSQYWKRDPSWQFVMTRLESVHPDDVDRVIDEAIDELLDSDIPLSRNTKQYIKEDRHARVDPKRRERNRDRALAFIIVDQVNWLENLLEAADFKDAKTRAEEYLARHWRKVAMEDGRSRFSSGPALNAWVRWVVKRTREKTP
jgi:hypothetical protein